MAGNVNNVFGPADDRIPRYSERPNKDRATLADDEIDEGGRRACPAGTTRSDYRRVVLLSIVV